MCDVVHEQVERSRSTQLTVRYPKSRLSVSCKRNTVGRLNELRLHSTVNKFSKCECTFLVDLLIVCWNCVSCHVCAECDDGFFGSSCESECHCDNEEVCAKDSGACPGLCAAGWNGTACQTGAGRCRFNCFKNLRFRMVSTMWQWCLHVISNLLV